MTIQERLTRMNNEDIQYLGDVVERALGNQYDKSEFCIFLESLIEDKNLEELNVDKPILSESRILGRIEFGKRLLTDLRNFITERDNLRAPVRRKKREKPSPLAHDPEVPQEPIPQMGGMV